MRWRLGQIGKTEIWLHGATLFCWAYFLLQGQGLLLAVSLGSIMLHEGAHGFAAILLHCPPSFAELTPLGLMLRLEDEDALSASKRAAILLAGPLMSLLLTLLGWFGTANELLPSAVGARLFFGNLALLVLNLLPALPLDGGRLLALLLSLCFPLPTQMKVLRLTTCTIGILLLLTGIFSAAWLGLFNLSLCIIGCFLLYAAYVCTTTEAMTTLRQFLHRRNLLEIRGFMPCASLAVMAHTPLRTVLHYLPAERYTQLTILESGTLRILETVDEEKLQATYVNTPDACCEALLSNGKNIKQHK